MWCRRVWVSCRRAREPPWIAGGVANVEEPGTANDDHEGGATDAARGIATVSGLAGSAQGTSLMAMEALASQRHEPRISTALRKAAPYPYL